MAAQRLSLDIPQRGESVRVAPKISFTKNYSLHGNTADRGGFTGLQDCSGHIPKKELQEAQKDATLTVFTCQAAAVFITETARRTGIGKKAGQTDTDCAEPHEKRTN